MKQERFNQIINDLNDLKKFTKENITNKNIIAYVTDIVSEIKKRHRHWMDFSKSVHRNYSNTCRRSKKQDFL